MAYTYIDPTRYDAESPITESLMTDIIENIVSNSAGGTYTTLTGSGTYSVPAGITKLKVVMVSGGGGGGSGTASLRNGGGGGGRVKIINVSTTGGSVLNYVCGSGGATDTSGGTTTFNGVSIAGGSTSIIYGGNMHRNSVLDQDIYCGGSGGNGTTADLAGRDGSSSLPVSGVAGTSTSTSGGGGGPMALPLLIDGVEAYLGAGGNGGDGSTGANATLNGAGGGGGGSGATYAGGSGSAGIIFVLPVG